MYGIIPRVNFYNACKYAFQSINEYDKAHEIDLPDFEHDEYIHIIVLILQQIVSNQDFIVDIRFEAAYYQYQTATCKQYFSDRERSVFYRDIGFHLLLKMSINFIKNSTNTNYSRRFEFKEIDEDNIYCLRFLEK